MSEKPHIGDIGTHLRFPIQDRQGIPISFLGLSRAVIICTKPDGSEDELVPDSATDSVVTYNVKEPSLWSTSGEYYFKVRLEFGNGNKFTTNYTIVKVDD